MSSTITDLINYNFGGIRRKDSIFSADKITCSDCQNVELYFTTLNSGVGIRTTKGNYSITHKIPLDENVIGMFESNIAGVRHLFVYTESQTVGRLYDYSIISDSINLLVDNLSVTGKACGVDFAQGWLDVFVFSNGEQIKFIQNSEDLLSLHVCTDDEINYVDPDTGLQYGLLDEEGRQVKGLGLVVFDSRLWIFDGKKLWYSEQGVCKNFVGRNNDDITNAGFITRTKDITAIYPYLGTLAVFHKDSSVLVQTDSTTKFKQDDESPGGCANYNSLVFHGTDLYFYDDTKKGVFSFQQIINGDKTLGQNIALDIQDELLQIAKQDVDKIRVLSVVTADRNEVWFLLPIEQEQNRSCIMIFDYIRGEWVKRKCQTINCMAIYESKLYSAGKQIYEEYAGDTFDGEFIDSFYRCTTLNLGSDNTLKITKFPPRITIDGNYITNFWVKYVRNYNTMKEPKTKEITVKTMKGVLQYDSGMSYDTVYTYLPQSFNAIVKLPSATFKALEITFYTEKAQQAFCIKAIEFSKIKVKQV